ncbi:MAG: hypothetical protein JXX28_04500 [Deltaproteobacteria bacterium]|nr:hypothetical protein [Deltaproteobacteria bacterium]
MYNTLLSVAAGLAVYALIALTTQPLAAIFPALIATAVVFFFLNRRTGQQVSLALEAAMASLKEQKIDEGVRVLLEVRERYRLWQPLLGRQIDAQLGMIRYVQMQWDDALPLLQHGAWRNWTAQTCVGAIHYRQGDKDQAWKSFAGAAKVAPRETIIYLVWATLLTREGLREEALAALGQGLKAAPASEDLQRLQRVVANKKKIEPRTFPQSWYQFFPEDIAKQLGGRTVANGPMPGPGFAPSKVSRKARRG